MMRCCWLLLPVSIVLAMLLPLEGAELPRSAQRSIDAYDKDVAEAQATYDEAVAKAVAAVVKDLTEEMDKATKKGDLDLALALRTKIEELQPSSSEEKGSATDLLAPAPRVIEIPATSDGVSIGQVQAGQRIMLAYVSGAWGRGASMTGNPVSPDAAHHPTVQAELAGPNGASELLPNGTANRPHVVQVTESGEYVLRIYDSQRHDNFGSASYRVIVR